MWDGKVNFKCQLDWDTGFPDICSTLFWMSWDKINI